MLLQNKMSLLGPIPLTIILVSLIAIGAELSPKVGEVDRPNGRRLTIRCMEDLNAYCQEKKRGFKFTDGCRECKCDGNLVRCKTPDCVYFVDPNTDPVAYCRTIFRRNNGDEITRLIMKVKETLDQRGKSAIVHEKKQAEQTQEIGGKILLLKKPTGMQNLQKKVESHKITRIFADGVSENSSKSIAPTSVDTQHLAIKKQARFNAKAPAPPAPPRNTPIAPPVSGPSLPIALSMNQALPPNGPRLSMLQPSVGSPMNAPPPPVGLPMNEPPVPMGPPMDAPPPPMGPPMDAPPPPMGLPMDAPPPPMGPPMDAPPPPMGPPMDAPPPPMGQPVNAPPPPMGQPTDAIPPPMGPPMDAPPPPMGLSVDMPPPPMSPPMDAPAPPVGLAMNTPPSPMGPPMDEPPPPIGPPTNLLSSPLGLGMDSPSSYMEPSRQVELPVDTVPGPQMVEPSSLEGLPHPSFYPSAEESSPLVSSYHGSNLINNGYPPSSWLPPTPVSQEEEVGGQFYDRPQLSSLPFLRASVSPYRRSVYVPPSWLRMKHLPLISHNRRRALMWNKYNSRLGQKSLSTTNFGRVSHYSPLYLYVRPFERSASMYTPNVNVGSGWNGGLRYGRSGNRIHFGGHPKRIVYRFQNPSRRLTYTSQNQGGFINFFQDLVNAKRPKKFKNVPKKEKIGKNLKDAFGEKGTKGLPLSFLLPFKIPDIPKKHHVDSQNEPSGQPIDGVFDEISGAPDDVGYPLRDDISGNDYYDPQGFSEYDMPPSSYVGDPGYYHPYPGYMASMYTPVITPTYAPVYYQMQTPARGFYSHPYGPFPGYSFQASPIDANGPEWNQQSLSNRFGGYYAPVVNYGPVPHTYVQGVSNTVGEGENRTKGNHNSTNVNGTNADVLSVNRRVNVSSFNPDRLKGKWDSRTREMITGFTPPLQTLGAYILHDRQVPRRLPVVRATSTGIQGSPSPEIYYNIPYYEERVPYEAVRSRRNTRTLRKLLKKCEDYRGKMRLALKKQISGTANAANSYRTSFIGMILPLWVGVFGT
ncbi:unnamed protein product [Calicophoron daubneyi]|uniref:Uncharacterized protein n=1 Tax=Calicophoron daubneyi TaxID=300641 RepID=A0AAV2TGG2_CALDB